MRQLRTMVLAGASACFLLSATACTLDDDGGGDGGGETTSSSQAGVYRGTYEVPVSAELAAAAVFDVPEIEWEIGDGNARLEYELPLALVGKKLRVKFSGPLDTAGSATLAGPPGDAACDIAAATVACTEHMPGLLPIEPDLAVVEQLAASDFAGPAALRVDVAKQFSVDPIGIVHIDLGAPAAEPGETD